MLSLLQWLSLETKRKWNEQVKWLNRGTANFKDPKSKLLWREGKVSIILESLDGNFRGEESVAFQPKERKTFAKNKTIQHLIPLEVLNNYEEELAMNCKS